MGQNIDVVWMLFFNFIHLIRELFNIQKNIGKKYGGIKQLMKYSQKKRGPNNDT